MTPSIAVSGLGLAYGDTKALSDLDLSLTGPGIHGLIGRNGSGKSSLLALLAGFRRPSSGTVRVHGAEVFENGAVMAEICLIREGADTVEASEKVSEALRFAAHMRPRWDADYAASLIERFGLSTKKRIDALSRGQRAALACTLGLAARAPLTMFDEAYLGLDAPSRYAFYDELLRDYLEHPRLVIVSTHLIEEVSRLFETVVMIDHGRLVLHRPLDELAAHGATLTGPAAQVEAAIAGRSVLNRRQLGGTTQAALYGEIDAATRRGFEAAGLEVGLLPLQDLFIHLTDPKREENRP